MKFTLINNIKKNPFFKTVLTFLTLFFALFLVFNTLLDAHSIGFFASEVIATLHGDEETFIEPMLLDTLLIHIHQRLFFNVILLSLLFIVYVRLSPYPRAILLHLFFSMALLAPLLLLLTFYLAPFVYLYLLAYYLWHLGALSISGVILWHLHR